MEELKTLFGEESLDYATFEHKLNESGIKLANLKSGGYVDKAKYDKLNSDFAKYKTDNDPAKYADYDVIKSELETLKAEKAEAELLRAVATAKVNKKFSKFVVSEVKPLVTDDKDFNTCLTEYLKQNPQFVENQNNGGNQGFFAKGDSSLNLDGKSTQSKSISDKMNKMIKGAIGK